MTNFARANTFSAGAKVVASEHNANWSGLETFLNSTGIPKLQDGAMASGPVTLSSGSTVIGYQHLQQSGGVNLTSDGSTFSTITGCSFTPGNGHVYLLAGTVVIGNGSTALTQSQLRLTLGIVPLRTVKEGGASGITYQSPTVLALVTGDGASALNLQACTATAVVSSIAAASGVILGIRVA